MTNESEYLLLDARRGRCRTLYIALGDLHIMPNPHPSSNLFDPHTLMRAKHLIVDVSHRCMGLVEGQVRRN